MNANHGSKLDLSASQPLESVNGILFGKRVFAGIIKGLKMTLSQIIHVGPTSSDKYPCKRQKRIHRQRRGHVMTETETGVMQPQAQYPRSPQEPGEAGRHLPWSLQGEQALGHLDFRLVASRPSRELVIAAPGLSHARIRHLGAEAGIGLFNPSLGKAMPTGACGSPAIGFQLHHSQGQQA